MTARRLTLLLSLAASTPWALSPDPDQAREWLREELSRREYQETLFERVLRWLDEVLSGLRSAAGTMGSLDPVVAILLVVVLAGLVALVLSRLRSNPVVPQGSAAVFTAAPETAAAHRLAAARALERGHWDEAVVESVRALASGLVERGLRPEQTDLTVHELAEGAATLFPSLAPRLRSASVAFDETRYGDRPADEDRARAAVAVELEASRLAPAATPGHRSAPAVPR